MSLPEAFGAPYEYTLGDKKLVFARLPMGKPIGTSAYSSIAAVVKALGLARRNKLLEQAKETGLNKEATARHLAIGEAEPLSIYHTYAYAGSVEGAYDVASRSLRLSGLSEKEIDAVLPEIEAPILQEIAEYVIGYIVQKPKDDKKEEGVNPPSASGESTGNATAG
jgi:hypothetical protein